MTTADALLSAVLAAPGDPLPRLVLADFLDDTGSPGTVAWAEYVRNRSAAATEPNPVRRELLRDAAADAAGRITAALTLPAAAFLADVSGFLDLLPAGRFTLSLAGFTPPRHLRPADVCRMRRGVPLGRGGGFTVVGVIDAAGPAERAAWVDDRGLSPVLLVRVPTDELEAAIERASAPLPLAVYDPLVTVTPLPTTLDDQLEAASAGVMRQFVEQLVQQARQHGATAIDITAYADHYWVRRLEGGKNRRWHRVGVGVGRELVRAAKALAGRRLAVRVRPRNSSSGDGVRIQLLNLPPAAVSVPPAG